MPVDFVSDEQAATYGSFTTDPSVAEVQRFLADQLEIADASCVKKYVERAQTACDHAWEIRDRYGYRNFDDPGCGESFARFLDGRAWTHAEGPMALLEHAVGWLCRHRVVLPGVTALARRVASARDTAEAWLYESLSAAAKRAEARGCRADWPSCRRCRTGRGTRRWDGTGSRRGAAREPKMVKALQRAEQIAALGVGRVEVSRRAGEPAQRSGPYRVGQQGVSARPVGRAEEGGDPARGGTAREAAAVDDNLDLLALLMATRLFCPARRASAEQRLPKLPRPERAAKTVALASRVLFDALTAAEGSTDQLDVSALWAAIETVAPRSILLEWPDMQRVAGSLVTNQIRAYDLLRMFGRDGHPTPLGPAFAEYDRIANTLHLLAVVDPIDDTYQRRMNRQLTIQESHHRLGRKVCHGNRGQIRQTYREGQGDQLAALGLVLNAVVLWHTRYLDAIVEDLRGKGFPVRDEDVGRLSPLGHAHLNCLGRYAFTARAVDGLRPLRDAAACDDSDDER